MEADRRSVILGALAAAVAAHPLAACADPSAVRGKTKVHVMGTIHSRHRTSETYSLEHLRAAIRKSAPDIVLTEIPPDRIERALRSFEQTGIVDEPRTRVFPEYTEVLFPLKRELGFEVVGTSGWTREIADDRREAIARIRNDRTRRAQWNEYQAALREFSRAMRGRGDDPHFIHTPTFDRLVATPRELYARYFDADLGPGGWTQINQAHTSLINSALDHIGGKEMTALVTFGTAHKYKILESIAQRDDIVLQDTRALFA